MIREMLKTCPLEIVTNLRDKEPCVEDDEGMSGGNVEALPGTSRAHSVAPRKKKKEKVRRTWRKEDLSVDDTDWKGELPSPPDEVLSPYEYFRSFFDEDMVDILRYQSNLYSTQKKGTCANITEEEMKHLSILLISGTVTVPHYQMFWQRGTRFAPVADLMSRNRFEAIHQCLHMNDNLQAVPRDSEGHDRLFMVCTCGPTEEEHEGCGSRGAAKH